jgi:hypothetical protein
MHRDLPFQAIINFPDPSLPVYKRKELRVNKLLGDWNGIII